MNAEAHAVLHRIVKAYDVRGLVADVPLEVVRALGAAAARELIGPSGRCVVGRDMRPSSPSWVDALADGLMSAGVEVIDLGLASTDQVSFASGELDAAAAMVTASHNPASYNGIKWCRPGAVPVAIDTGLATLRDLALDELRRETTGPGNPQIGSNVEASDPRSVSRRSSAPGTAIVGRGSGRPRSDTPRSDTPRSDTPRSDTPRSDTPPSDTPRSDTPPSNTPGRGARRHVDLLPRFAEHVRSFVDVDRLREVSIAVDAGNGMAGMIWPEVVAGLPITTEPLYFDLDGTFPNHPADPLDPANLSDLAERVTGGGHALGLAFDGDADRVFAVDEQGRPVPSSLVGAVVAHRLLQREPGATVLHNLICSRIVPETIRAAGGIPERTRVGHSFIKRRMAETGAVFAVEHSGHYYFRDNYRADSGVIAALLVIEAVADADAPLSEVLAPYDRYVSSGERNLDVAEPDDVLRRVEAAFAPRAERLDHEDGLTISLGAAWFNLRPSNTEPVLRLNAEAVARSDLDDLVAEVLEAIGDRRR